MVGTHDEPRFAKQLAKPVPNGASSVAPALRDAQRAVIDGLQRAERVQLAKIKARRDQTLVSTRLDTMVGVAVVAFAVLATLGWVVPLLMKG